MWLYNIENYEKLWYPYLSHDISKIGQGRQIRLQIRISIFSNGIYFIPQQWIFKPLCNVIKTLVTMTTSCKNYYFKMTIFPNKIKQLLFNYIDLKILSVFILFQIASKIYEYLSLRTYFGVS